MSALKIHHQHPWDLSPGEALELQRRLRGQVVFQPLDTRRLQTVGGVDASYHAGKARAGIAVLAFPSLEMVDQATAEMPTPFPYIPGLLSFREAPVILQALQQLNSMPDVLLFDGHGYAHPRRFGIACHVGVLVDIPTIGCAKSILIGEHDPLGETAGGTAQLFDGNEVIGALVRTRTRVRPVIVSVGHRVDLTSAIETVLACRSGYRLPEPIRMADRLASHTGQPPKPD
ncbi:MAG: deoxyribonuclease V [Anaerolineales bacterium]|jgi:deoxyribonuclease V